jgi:hypothetical protein
MDIKVTPRHTTVSIHADQDTPVEVRAFPKGEDGRMAFVILSLGGWERELQLFLTPEVAAQLGGELSLAAVDALCPDEVEATQ